MPPLLADFTHARPCKPFCEKYLTLPGVGQQLDQQVRARVAHQAGGLQQAYVLAARDLRGRGGRPVQQIGGQVAAVQKAQQPVGRGYMRVDGAVGVPVPLHFGDPRRQRARPDLAALPHKLPQPLQRRRVGFERLGGEAFGSLLGQKALNIHGGKDYFSRGGTVSLFHM